MAKTKKEKEDAEVDEVEGSAEVEDAPAAKVTPQEYEAIKDQARREVLLDIQRGALSVPKAVFRKDAKSALQPVKASVAFNSKNQLTPEENDLPPGSNDLVEIDIDERLYVNGKELFGKTIVKKHEADSLKHMIQQKKTMDHESTIGRNFLSKKLANGVIETREVQSVTEELNKATGRR